MHKYRTHPSREGVLPFRYFAHPNDMWSRGTIFQPLQPSYAATPRFHNLRWAMRVRNSCDKITRGWTMIGDSHIERFNRPELDHLSLTSTMEVTNLGFGGDRAEHVLWRIQHTLVEVPIAAIICVGGNNLEPHGNNNPMILNTILNIVYELISRRPTMKLAVLALLPRLNARITQQAEEVNRALRYTLPPEVTMIDIPAEIRLPSALGHGTYTKDKVHLNEEGYYHLSPHLLKFFAPHHTL